MCHDQKNQNEAQRRVSNDATLVAHAVTASRCGCAQGRVTRRVTCARGRVLQQATSCEPGQLFEHCQIRPEFSRPSRKIQTRLPGDLYRTGQYPDLGESLQDDTSEESSESEMLASSVHFAPKSSASFLQTSSASCGGSFARSTCVMDFCLSMQCCTLSSKPVILLMCTCIASLSGQAPGLPLETSFITDCVPRDSHAKNALVRDVGSWVLLRCVGSQVGCAEVRGVSCWRVCSNRVRGVGSPRPLGVGSPRERGVGSRSATLDATKPLLMGLLRLSPPERSSSGAAERRGDTTDCAGDCVASLCSTGRLVEDGLCVKWAMSPPGRAVGEKSFFALTVDGAESLLTQSDRGFLGEVTASGAQRWSSARNVGVEAFAAPGNVAWEPCKLLRASGGTIGGRVLPASLAASSGLACCSGTVEPGSFVGPPVPPRGTPHTLRSVVGGVDPATEEPLSNVCPFLGEVITLARRGSLERCSSATMALSTRHNAATALVASVVGSDSSGVLLPLWRSRPETFDLSFPLAEPFSGRKANKKLDSAASVPIRICLEPLPTATKVSGAESRRPLAESQPNLWLSRVHGAHTPRPCGATDSGFPLASVCAETLRSTPSMLGTLSIAERGQSPDRASTTSESSIARQTRSAQAHTQNSSPSAVLPLLPEGSAAVHGGRGQRGVRADQSVNCDHPPLRTAGRFCM